jgi:hypothetical protein
MPWPYAILTRHRAETMYDSTQQHDDSAEFENAESAVATLEEDAQPNDAIEWMAPRCEKCEAPLKSDVVTICRKCGWYPSLGTFVEVDADWEIDGETGAVATQLPKKSHLRVWLDLMPRWSWVIIGSMLAVLVESVAVRLATPVGSSIRTIWSLSQLVLGVVAFLGCHIFNFIVLAAEDADFGVMDMFLKPLKLWIRAAQELPKRLWVSNAAASAITAAALSVLVIGGIPYERFWNWGFDAPAKQELMGAVMDRVRELESRNEADSLEDAIGDFAGTQDGLVQTPDPDKLRERADCVILGYQLDKEGRLSTLVLGTTHLGNLVHAGSVTPKMPEHELAELVRTLADIQAPRPLITIESDRTIWVKPMYTCRVSFMQRQKGRLTEIEWDKLLGTINIQPRRAP